MARTATVIAPTGLVGPKLLVYDEAGVQQESIGVSAVGTNASRYQGTISVVAGTYTFELDVSNDVIGAWTGVRVTGVDPENVIVRDPVNDIDGIHVGQSYLRTNSSGDTLVETITEN